MPPTAQVETRFTFCLAATLCHHSGRAALSGPTISRRARASALAALVALSAPLPLAAGSFYGEVRGALFGCHNSYTGKAVLETGIGRFGLSAPSSPPPSYQAYTGGITFTPDPLRPDDYDLISAGDWLVVGQRNGGRDVWNNVGSGNLAGFRHFPLPSLRGSGQRGFSTIFVRGVGQITHTELPSAEVAQKCNVDWVFVGQERSTPPRPPPSRRWSRDTARPSVQHQAQTGGAGRPKASASAAATVEITHCAAQTLCFGESTAAAPELLVRSRVVAGRVVIAYLPLSTHAIEVWSQRAGEPSGNARSWLVPEAFATGIVRVGFVDLVGYAAGQSLTEQGLTEQSPQADTAGLQSWPEAERDAADDSPMLAEEEQEPIVDVWPANELAVAGTLPPPPGTWLTTPALPGFRFKATLAGAALVTANPCPRQTLCLASAANAPPQIAARLTPRQANGKRWLLAGKFADPAAELWVQQGTNGQIRHYTLRARKADSSWLPGITDRAAFGG